MDLNTELAAMADQMEKSTQNGADLVKATVLQLGPQGLKAVLPTLDAGQKALLKSVLEDMAKGGEGSGRKGHVTYHRGDKIRYTGNKSEAHGATWHEFKYLDGHKKGQLGVTARAPGSDVDPVQAEHAQLESAGRTSGAVPQLDGSGNPLKKSHDEPIQNREYSLEPVSNSTEVGDYEFNEDSKLPQDERDEKLVEEAKKRKQMEMRNQGGIPVEGGWEGQVIKAESEEEESDDEYEMPKKEAIAEHKNLVSVLQSPSHKDDKKEAKKQKKELNDMEKSAAKTNLKVMITRMQERGLDRDTCVTKLSKSLNASVETVATLWDATETLRKSDVIAEKGNPEGSQVQPPEQMRREVSAGVNDPEDPSVPKYKDKSAKARGEEAPAGGKAHQTADEGQQPPKPLAKSDSYWHEETPVYLAKSKDPFAVRSVGQNKAYKVDEFIALESASREQRLAKSTFDYLSENSEQSMKKAAMPGQEPSPSDVIAANQKKASDDAKAEAESLRQGKVDSKLQQIQEQSGAKVGPKLAKSFVNDLIASSADMGMDQVERAISSIGAKPSKDSKLVKSFDDSEMESLFQEPDMWKSQK